MTVTDFIEQRIRKERVAAIKERILEWLEKADSASVSIEEILEIPRMQPEDSSQYAKYIPTGEVSIVLKLKGILGIKAKLLDANVTKNDPDNWTVE